MTSPISSVSPLKGILKSSSSYPDPVNGRFMGILKRAFRFGAKEVVPKSLITKTVGIDPRRKITIIPGRDVGLGSIPQIDSSEEFPDISDAIPSQTPDTEPR